MKWKIVLWFFIIVLIWGGTQETYTALTNLKPTRLSMSEYLTKRPSALWLNLTDSQLDIMQASFKHSSLGAAQNKETREASYIPIQPAGVPNPGPISVILDTHDEGILSLIDSLRGVEQLQRIGTDPGAVNEKFFKATDPQEINGLVAFGLNSRSTVNRKLTELYPNLDPNFIVIKHNKKPDNPFSSMALLIVGLGLAAWQLKRNFLQKPNSPSQTSFAQRR